MFQVSGTAGLHLQIVRQQGGHKQELIAIDLGWHVHAAAIMA